MALSGTEPMPIKHQPKKQKDPNKRTKSNVRTRRGTKRHAGGKLAKKYGGYKRLSDYTESTLIRLGHKIDPGKPDHAARICQLPAPTPRVHRHDVSEDGHGHEH